MTERILVVDPGERVGWCHAVIDPSRQEVRRAEYEVPAASPKRRGQGATKTVAAAEIVSNPFITVTGHGITPLMDFALKLHEVIGEYDTVIYETWRLYPNKAKQLIGSDMQSSQFVGMVRLCARLHPEVKLVSQGADCMKTGIKVAPPAIAEILDRLPKSHDEAHDGSALAHLSYYWFKRYAR